MTANNSTDSLFEEAIRNTIAALGTAGQSATTPQDALQMARALEMLGGRASILDILSASQQQRNEIEQAYGVTTPGGRPFIYGAVAPYFANKGGLRSELGNLHVNQGETLLKLISDCLETEGYNTMWAAPRMCFASGDNWRLSQSYAYAPDINSSYYPIRPISVMFVKNTTAADIVRTVGFYISSEWVSGFEGSSLNVAVPQQTEGTTVTTLGYHTVHRYTGQKMVCQAATRYTLPC